MYERIRELICSNMEQHKTKEITIRHDNSQENRKLPARWTLSARRRSLLPD